MARAIALPADRGPDHNPYIREAVQKQELNNKEDVVRFSQMLMNN